MKIKVFVPVLGESITEATIGKWCKKIGDSLAKDDPIVELETDKVTIEIPSPISGKLTEIFFKRGETVNIGSCMCLIDEDFPIINANSREKSETSEDVKKDLSISPSPSAAKLIAEHKINCDQIKGSGKHGQILKEDVLNILSKEESNFLKQTISYDEKNSIENRVPMSKLRQTIASRLKYVQNHAAILTTFNEVDMSSIIELRKTYKDLFEKKHNVKLGFMGFFTKSVSYALKEIPILNSEIDGSDILYKKYIHIGIAVSTNKGLVVPVIRHADSLSISEIEQEIIRLSHLARDFRLNISDMQGGTFTITNGGIYGSLMSTPILNLPQSGILGMHSIKDRPIAFNGKIVIHPMMYLALSYDHRIVDGKEAVSFLVKIKEKLENPERLILDI